MRSALPMFTMLAASSALAQPAYQPVYGGPPPAATPAPLEEEDGPFVFAAAHVGVNAPYGALGLELGAGLPWLRGSISVGRGWRGINAGAMGRLVKELGPLDLGLGVGASLGPALHTLGADADGTEVHYGDDTVWLDVELSVETRLAHGGFTRIYAGVTGARDIECVAVDAATELGGPCDGAQLWDLENDGFLPYVGIAGGFRWPEAPKSKPRYTPPPMPYGAPVWPAMPW